MIAFGRGSAYASAQIGDCPENPMASARAELRSGYSGPDQIGGSLPTATLPYTCFRGELDECSCEPGVDEVPDAFVVSAGVVDDLLEPHRLAGSARPRHQPSGARAPLAEPKLTLQQNPYVGDGLGMQRDAVVWLPRGTQPPLHDQPHLVTASTLPREPHQRRAGTSQPPALHPAGLAPTIAHPTPRG